MTGDSPQNRNESWNFRTLLSQGTFVNISYRLASANIVLPFLYMAVGAPVLFAGLILPIVQIANLISQLVAAPIVGGSRQRKWYLVLSIIIVAAATSVIGLVAHAAEDLAAVWLVMVFLLVAAVIGISQGLSGLAFKDLIGRVVPEQRRSTLLFAQTGLAGVFTVVIAYAAHRFVQHSDALDEHLELLWAGVVVMLLSGLAAALIRETPQGDLSIADETGAAADSPSPTPGVSLYGQLQYAIKIPWFRRFLVMRAMLLSIELATPFYALHAASQHLDDHRSLSIFVLASSIALIVSGMVWRRVSDYSVPTVFRLAAVLAVTAGLIAIASEMMPAFRNPWTHGAVFFFIVMATQGSSNARTLYLISLTPDDERPFFIAINSVTIGALGAVVAFAFGTLAHLQSTIWPVWCIVAANVLAGLYSWRLRLSRGEVKSSG